MTTSSHVSPRRPTVGPDEESRRWVRGLKGTGRQREATIEALHSLLLRVAAHEVRRRRAMLGNATGPELDDLAHQAADDALLAVAAKVDEFRGESRFTTWAFKFVLFEVASKVARHAWRRQVPAVDEAVFDRLPDRLTAPPGDRAEQHDLLRTLRSAVDHDLTERQRYVFVAVALNETPIDVVAVALGSNRNAIYKNLFDARRRLRASLAAAGHPLTPAEATA